jgi:hypothetical protein
MCGMGVEHDEFLHTGQFPGEKYAVISSVNLRLNSSALLCNWFLCSNMSERKVVKLKLLIMNV